MSDTKFTAEASSTASDTLAKKSTSSDVVSGGHLVAKALKNEGVDTIFTCLLYTSPSPRDYAASRMPSSA